MNITVTQIASVVLCAVGSGLLFSSFGYTPILGYIITGMVLGPHGLQFIIDKEIISVFSEMGILFLLFAIGLELSFERIKNIWKRSVISTILSTIFIYIAILIAGVILKLSYTHIMILAFCITLSSTALTVKSISSLKEQDESVNSSTFGILIAQDLIALVMVLVINLLGAHSAENRKVGNTVVILLFLFGIFFYFTRYHKHIHRFTNFIKKHDDVFALSIFGICLGSAVFSEIAGFSAPFGAFISGLILGNSNIKNEIKNIVAPIREILLMTFFLSVGLLVDFDFINANLIMIFSTLVFVAFGKTLINIFVLRLCKFPLKESFVISVLLGHIGEFSFMLAYAANKMNLISDLGVKFLVSLTVLSMLLSPFWLMFAERCHSLAKHYVVASSWEFLQLAGGKEIHKIERFSEHMSRFIKIGVISRIQNIYHMFFRK